MKSQSLKKFIYLSIAAAVVTISLKFIAYLKTGSMGFYSDALESIVNLLAAVIALILLHISEHGTNSKQPCKTLPPDSPKPPRNTTNCSNNNKHCCKSAPGCKPTLTNWQHT